MKTLLVTNTGRLRPLKWSAVPLMGLLAGLGAIVIPTPAQAETQSSTTITAVPAAPAPETLTVDLPEELGDLRDMGKEIGDRLSEIDPTVIQQVMRPLGRQALQIFLDSAPGLSQKAVELGEQGLAELEKRATERLEQAQREFEQNEP